MQRIEAIESSNVSASEKANSFLGLATELREQAKATMELSFVFHHQGDSFRSRKFANGAASLFELMELCQDKAKGAMSEFPRSFGYEGRQDAYPRWQVPNSEWRPADRLNAK